MDTVLKEIDATIGMAKLKIAMPDGSAVETAPVDVFAVLEECNNAQLEHDKSNDSESLNDKIVRVMTRHGIPCPSNSIGAIVIKRHISAICAELLKKLNGIDPV